jgi:hypothetical protein
MELDPGSPCVHALAGMSSFFQELDPVSSHIHVLHEMTSS